MTQSADKLRENAQLIMRTCKNAFLGGINF